MTTAYCLHRFGEFIEDVGVLTIFLFAGAGALALYDRITTRPAIRK